MEEINQIYSFPPLTEEEFAELKEDIAERGVMIPIEVDEAGAIIDGYHRFRACCELGITDIPCVCREGWTEQEKRTQAIKLNMARRHLTQEQKREFIRELIKETPEKSDRQIADEIGVSDKTVGAQRRDMESRAEIPHIDKVTDTLGREQPRQRKASEAKAAVPEAVDESASPTKKDIEGAVNKLVTGVKDSVEPKRKPEKDAYAPPRTMTPAEDFVMGMRDQADGLRRVLKVMLDDYAGNKELEEWLFSDEGIASAMEGISALKEVIEEYEKLIKSRKK